LALGFGVSVFVCFLVPLGAVLVMPAAVAGATLLTRHAYGLST
jgi:CysZ protein